MMKFRTRKDGVVYPLAGDGRKKKKGAGVVVAGAVLAGLVGTGAGGLGGSASVGVGVQARAASAKPAARAGQRSNAWRRMGFRTLKNTSRRDLNCVLHSYGQVRQFFLAAPCRSLDRALLVLADQDGTMVLSIYWVRMHGAVAAVGLRKVADTFGTGNVSPIAGTLLGLGGIRFTGRYYDSRRAGTLVVIAETEPVTGQTDAETLDAIADVAVELPPP